jgi:S1-C subfamily serine protease
VAWLRERWERSQLDALYLTDQALREGWGMGQLRSARLQQRREFQGEIGTAMYDLMLYATGRENRVVVRDVYVGSAAEASDLRPGDVIVAYAGTPVFDDRDLRLLSSSGEAGLPITIQVVRGGTLENLQIERGPLGVSTRRERVPPPRP